MNSRADRIYRTPTEPIEGLELDPDHGSLSVIIPEATTNLCTNPSFEYGFTTWWAGFGGSTIAITYNWQAFGAAGLSVIGTGGGSPPAAGCMYGPVALTAGVTYTASVTIQDDPGKIHYIQFTDNGGSVLYSRRWIATGFRQRIHATYTAVNSANHHIYLARDIQHKDTRPFYVDGLQVEAKAYPTTYCDGDQVGFVVGETPYLWTGYPGASTSTRGLTRAGGREVNLLDLGFHLLTILGLGLAGLVDQYLSMPGLGGLPQGTGTTVRDFQVVGSIYGDTPRHLSAIRAGIIDAFKPDATLNPQPLVLRYQHLDEDGTPDADCLDIQCKFLQGLEGNTGNQHQENLALSFRQYVPFIAGTYTAGIELGYQTAVANANYILKRGADGIWGAVGFGANGQVSALAIAPDNTLYMGGGFTRVGNAAPNDLLVNGIAQWNGAFWSALGSGVAGGTAVVYAIAVGPDGSIYIGGDFTSVNGVANTAYVAKWNGAVWSALGTGTNGIVYALAFDHSGNLFAGGAFSLAGGIANTRKIARWNGAAWQALSTGVSNAGAFVQAIAIGLDNTVYVAGDFTLIGSATVSCIASWNGVTFSPMGTGISGGGVGPIIYALEIGSDGRLYAGGNFVYVSASSVGHPGTVANGIAAWDGLSWRPLGSGLEKVSVQDTIYSLKFIDGNLYAAGYFTSIGGHTMPNATAFWSGSVWAPVDVSQPASPPYNYAMAFDHSKNFYVSFGVSGTAYSATVKAPDVGSASAHPLVKFTGPGTLYQLKNYTTGKSIFFNLTLLAGETALLNLDPFHPSFVSSFRGDIWGSAILPGSDLDFMLLPGANNISAFMYGSTSAATHIVMYYQPLYWSTDGAIVQ